jgi:nucleoside-diphosphate-sugar epimerase
VEIGVSGINGFVGKHVKEYLQKHVFLTLYPLNLREDINLAELNTLEVIIHLAGKAHDLKIVLQPEEYYQVNYELTKQLYNSFLSSDAEKFIFISSVKACADHIEGTLKESDNPDPKTHYGKSKLMAEQYIQSRELPLGKSYYILRPSMIHGPGNKGNLNLLFGLVSNGFPWPLGLFENSRSYLSIENLCFIIRELIERKEIPSGVYNVADDVPLSTKKVISLIAESKGKTPRIFNINKNKIKREILIKNLSGISRNVINVKKKMLL